MFLLIFYKVLSFLFSILADIIELFEAFKEHGVQRNLTIVRLILAAWSISLMQFTLVVTSTKKRKTITNNSKSKVNKQPEKCFTCRLFWETELWVSEQCLFNLFETIDWFDDFWRHCRRQFFYRTVLFYVFVLDWLFIIKLFHNRMSSLLRRTFLLFFYNCIVCVWSLSNIENVIN